MRNLRSEATKMYLSPKYPFPFINMWNSEEMEFLEDAAPTDEERFVVQGTGALLTLPSSLEKIYQFCNTLPADKYLFVTCAHSPLIIDIFTRMAPLFVPIIEKVCAFQYKLILPNNCPVREIEGNMMRNKQGAKQSATYNACRKLYELGTKFIF